MPSPSSLNKRPHTAPTTNPPPPIYTTTLWRSPTELADVRAKLFRLGKYKDDDRRREGIEQIQIWHHRTQHPLPLAIDSTLNLVAAVLQDEQGDLSSQSLALVYAGGIARFITGICDTRSNIERFAPGNGGAVSISAATSIPAHPPTMESSAKSLNLPKHLIETRHLIVHGEMPQLSVLKSAASASLVWLWEWYWVGLEGLVGPSNGVGLATVDEGGVEEALRLVLKRYVAGRKKEVRERVKKSEVSVAEGRSVVAICQGRKLGIRVLVTLLVGEGMIVPRKRSLRDPLDGAFTLYTPLLHALAISLQGFFTTFLESLVDVLVAKSRYREGEDPGKEAMAQWLRHVLLSREWEDVRRKLEFERVIWDVRVRLAVEGGSLGMGLLGDVKGEGVWGKVGKVVGGGDEVVEGGDGQDDEDVEVVEKGDGDKVPETVAKRQDVGGACGFERWEGRWERTPIGV